MTASSLRSYLICLQILLLSHSSTWPYCHLIIQQPPRPLSYVPFTANWTIIIILSIISPGLDKLPPTDWKLSRISCCQSSGIISLSHVYYALLICTGSKQLNAWNKTSCHLLISNIVTVSTSAHAHYCIQSLCLHLAVYHFDTLTRPLTSSLFYNWSFLSITLSLVPVLYLYFIISTITSQSLYIWLTFADANMETLIWKFIVWQLPTVACWLLLCDDRDIEHICGDRSTSFASRCLSAYCISENIDPSTTNDAASFLCNTTQQRSKNKLKK